MSAKAGSVLISCGEPSGENYASELAHQLKIERPEVRLVGIGGSRLNEQVEQIWAGLDELSVMGFAEVIRHLPRLRRLRERIAERAREEGVDLLLAVDYPGFHLSLAGAMKKRGIKTLHYIPPKTWSWGAWRNRALRASVHRCAVIFPFEENYYREHGIDATFVGHPLLDQHAAVLESGAARREGLLLIPGSRPQEIRRIGPSMAQAACRLRAEGAVNRVRVSRAPGLPRGLLAEMTQLCPELELVEGPLIQHLISSELAIVCSGTASVETALSRTPHVIVYRTSRLTYAVARQLATVQAIGMSNIVLGRTAFPEFLQKELHPESLVAAMRQLLDPKSAARAEQERAFDELFKCLGKGEGAARNVARMALQILDEKPV
ncbi:MAG TPA: lipid-A-disaccharide synthase [Candidatus Krumholzibacteria bacterium]|nr:lipid-A-disaccharide synthase [Candidatus Krumholzibacteria bacterium]